MRSSTVAGLPAAARHAQHCWPPWWARPRQQRARQQQHGRRTPPGGAGTSSSSSSASAVRAARREELSAPPSDPLNPDLDEIVLDDAYYEDMGMTREQALEQQRQVMYSADPEAMPLDALEQLSSVAPGTLSDELRAAVESLQVYGPQAVVMAGFRAEEYAVVRSTLDALGAHQVKVLPASEQMLRGTLDEALQAPEIDWSQPRPPEWILGGTWGSQRTVLFSGMSIKAQATLLELLEDQGLPHLCCTMALKEDAHKRLGDVLAVAVQAQRGRKPQPIEPWAMPPRTAPAGGSSGGGAQGGAAGAAAQQQQQRHKPAWRPGKRGALFERTAKPGVPVLEPLRDLITPARAAARLKVEPTPDDLTDLSELDLLPDEEEEDQGSSAGLGQDPQRGPGQPDSDAPPVSSLPEQDASDDALLSWFNDGIPGDAVELPWSEGEPAAAAAAAAVAAGSGLDSAQRAAAPAAPAPPAGSGSEPPPSLDDLLAPLPASGSSGVQEGSSQLGPLPLSSPAFQQQRQQQQQAATAAAAAAAVHVAAGAAGTGDAVAAAAAARLAAAAAGLAATQGGGSASVLASIQAALKSGVDAEQLKQLVDEAAAAAAGPPLDPLDQLLAAGPAAAAAPASSRPSGRPAPQQPQPPRARPLQAGAAPQQPPQPQPQPSLQPAQPARAGPFGPAPPPPGADPLFKLRPEVQRAFENKQIKFVDMNRLPKKYRQGHTMAALQQQREQQQAARLAQEAADDAAAAAAAAQQGAAPGGQQQRWWRQQSPRQQLLQGLPGQALSQLPAGGKVVAVDVGGPDGGSDAAAGPGAAAAAAAAGGQPAFKLGGRRFSDMAAAAAAPAEAGTDQQPSAAGGGAPQQQQPAPGMAWQELEEGEQDDGGDAPVDPEQLQLDEAKLQALVDSARQQGLDVPRALAEALAFGVTISPQAAAAVGVALPGAAHVAAARAEIAAAVRAMQADGDADDAGTAEAAAPAPVAATAAEPAGRAGQPAAGGSGSGASSRAWGAGITGAVERARARAAARRRQQQQEQLEQRGGL